MIIAYLCIRTDKNDLESQREEITQYITGKNKKVNEWIIKTSKNENTQNENTLKEIINRLQKDDTLITTNISHLGGSLNELSEVLSSCLEKGINVCCLRDRYIFNQSLDWKNMIKAFQMADHIEQVLASTDKNNSPKQK